METKNLSVGSGIAIAGVWFAGAGLSGLFGWLMFAGEVWSETKVDGAVLLFIFTFVLLPIIMAYFAMTRILGQHKELENVKDSGR